jgi:hypothetical protein
MYGSVKSCVTAGNSSAPILTWRSLTAFFSSARQNWYVQPSESSAAKTSSGSAVTRARSRD